MISRFFNLLHKYLLPNCCLICNKSLQIEGYFCEKCWPTLGFVGDAICKVCCREFTIDISDLQNTCAKCIINAPIYDESRALMKFTPNSQKLIHQFQIFQMKREMSLYLTISNLKYQIIIKNLLHITKIKR